MMSFGSSFFSKPASETETEAEKAAKLAGLTAAVEMGLGLEVNVSTALQEEAMAQIEQIERIRAELNTVSGSTRALRLVVGEYTATTSYYFLLLLASPARVKTI